jgi:uncharacterized membrane protein
MEQSPATLLTALVINVLRAGWWLCLHTIAALWRIFAMRLNIPLVASLATVGLVLLQRSHHRSHASLRADLPAELLEDDRAGRSRTLGLAALLGAGGMLLLDSRLQYRERAGHTVHESVELDVPVSTAYNQWTQFKEFPTFMASVQEVRQLDDTHLHWKAVVAGKVKEWDAEITEQIPDQRIAWRSTSGADNSGVVTFHPLSDSRSRVELQMQYQPETFTEQLADAVGGVKLTTRGNLRRFKMLVETRGKETGAWRGTVTAH